MFSSTVITAFVFAALATNVNAAVAAVAAAASPEMALVGCFSGGQSGDCSTVINDFCASGFTLGGHLGTTRCFNVNNYHCDLTVGNTAGSTQSISADVCKADMLVTNNGCNGHGGIRADGNFELTIDPNAGSC